jgi:hypothetical protein
MSKLAPEHWRDRAKEARAKAEQIKDPRAFPGKAESGIPITGRI